MKSSTNLNDMSKVSLANFAPEYATSRLNKQNDDCSRICEEEIESNTRPNVGPKATSHRDFPKVLSTVSDSKQQVENVHIYIDFTEFKRRSENEKIQWTTPFDCHDTHIFVYMEAKMGNITEIDPFYLIVEFADLGSLVELAQINKKSNEIVKEHMKNDLKMNYKKSMQTLRALSKYCWQRVKRIYTEVREKVMFKYEYAYSETLICTVDMYHEDPVNDYEIMNRFDKYESKKFVNTFTIEGVETYRKQTLSEWRASVKYNGESILSRKSFSKKFGQRKFDHCNPYMIIRAMCAYSKEWNRLDYLCSEIHQIIGTLDNSVYNSANDWHAKNFDNAFGDLIYKKKL